jgi:hypothetical protein
MSFRARREARAVALKSDAEHLAVRIAVVAMRASAVELGSLDRGRQLAFRDKIASETYFVTLAPLSPMGLGLAERPLSRGCMMCWWRGHGSPRASRQSQGSTPRIHAKET